MIFSLVYLLLKYIKCELYLKSREQRAMLKSPPEGEKTRLNFCVVHHLVSTYLLPHKISLNSQQLPLIVTSHQWRGFRSLTVVTES